MAVLITRRAIRSIRGLYFQSTRGHINRVEETTSLVDSLISIVNAERFKSSSNTRGVLSEWRRRGYTVLETNYNFIRKFDASVNGEIPTQKKQSSRSDFKRKWYFACVLDSATNTIYIADAVYAPYIDRVVRNLPLATNFMLAMRSLISRRNNANIKQLKIPFKESRIRITESMLKEIITEVIRKVLRT